MHANDKPAYAKRLPELPDGVDELTGEPVAEGALATPPLLELVSARTRELANFAASLLPSLCALFVLKALVTWLFSGVERPPPPTPAHGLTIPLGTAALATATAFLAGCVCALCKRV